MSFKIVVVSKKRKSSEGVCYGKPVNPWYVLCKSLYLPMAQSRHKTPTCQVTFHLTDFQIDLWAEVEVLETSTVGLLEFLRCLRITVSTNANSI